MNVRYECAISGVEEEASVEASAPLGGLPVGWFRITFIPFQIPIFCMLC